MNTPKMVMPARYAVIMDPMRELCTSDMQPVPSGAVFFELVEPGSTWMCQIAGDGMEGGQYLPREWWHTEPRPGDVIVFHRRALGGGNGRSLLQLAVILIAAYASSGASLYATGAGYSAAGAAAIGAGTALGVSLLGNALINAVIPLDQGNLAGGAGGQSPTYNVDLQGNRARLGQPIPVLYGHNLTYPDFPPDCEPYQVFVGNVQFYHAIMCVGMGYMDVLRVSIEDTPIELFTDVEYLVIGPGQADGETIDDQSLVKTTVKNNVEAANQELVSLKIVRFVVVPRDRDAISLGVDVALPRGLAAGKTVTWRVQAQAINDFEAPIGTWTTLADETYSTASAIPVRLSYSYAVAAGRYQVRIYRTDIRDTDANAAHDLSLIGLTCELNTSGVDTSIPATYVVIKMKATQQLNAISQRRVRVLSTRRLPFWSGTTWSTPLPTRSIAWAAADVLRNTDYGRGLPTEQIDTAALLNLNGVWLANYDNYDGSFDTLTDTWSALSQVLRVGRAVPLIRGSKFSFVRDAEDLEPVALYGMRNIRKSSFSLDLSVPERDRVNALDLEYWDQNRWDWVTITVQYVGAGEPEPFIVFDLIPPSPYTISENRASLRIPGIIGRNHASRWGAYTLANMLFRTSFCTYRTHLDGLLPAYAAPVQIAHDVPGWGQSGDVVDWDAGAGVVTTTEPLTWGASTHYMQLHMAAGPVTWEVTEGAEPNEAIVVDDLGVTPSFESSNRERTRYLFGPSTNMGAICRVKRITPRGERDIEMRVVLEDERVHSADEPFRFEDDPISDGTSTPPEGSDVLVVRLLDRSITGTTLDGVGDTGATILAMIQLNDDGTAQYGFIGSTSSDSGALPNEWLQAGSVPSATAALYEVRATVLSSSDPPSGGAVTLAGTTGAWLGLGATRQWELTYVTPGIGSAAVRVLYFEIRDVATETIQDVAAVTLLCEYPFTGGG